MKEIRERTVTGARQVVSLESIKEPQMETDWYPRAGEVTAGVNRHSRR